MQIHLSLLAYYTRRPVRLHWNRSESIVTGEKRHPMKTVFRIRAQNNGILPEIEVEIRGYTDNTGSYQGNVRISQRRADTVRDYMLKHGIAPYRMTTKGYGPESPIAPNTTREGRAMNRRIEFYRIK